MPRAGSIERRRARWKLLLLLLVCVSPVVASYFTYYVVRPEGGAISVRWCNPSGPCPTWRPPRHRAQWQPAFAARPVAAGRVSSARCDERCQNHLYLQRQMRESLARRKTGSTGCGW